MHRQIGIVQCCRRRPTHTQVALKEPSYRETTKKMISASIDGHGCPYIEVANLPSVASSKSVRKHGILRGRGVTS